MYKSALFVSFLILLGCGKEENENLVEHLFLEEASGVVNLKDYAGIAPEARFGFLFDDFEDNDQGWDVSNDAESSTRVEDGVYKIQSKNSTSFVFSISSGGLDFGKDFEMEASIKISQSGGAGRNGLVWGVGYSPFTFNNFSVNNQKETWIGVWDGNAGAYAPWNDWWLTGFVNPEGNFNKLTVRRVEGQYYFFVNEKFIAESANGGFSDDDIGFIVAGLSTIHVDYILINYLIL
ncbi:MAG: hypothetical protein IPH04_19265 [Saprospirales bacterium]|nr:hypothetical protein [Saprospirales bacterium]